MTIIIRNRWTAGQIYEVEAETLRDAVITKVAQRANLAGADLVDADLGGADLVGANLRDADLRDADLRGADLRGANLRGANLGGAKLRDADLRGANLRGANLGDADLRGAKLVDADLGGADLVGANLRDANLDQIKADLIWQILKLPGELEHLRNALATGRVNGSSYDGVCACLAGTIARHRGIKVASGSMITDNGCAFAVDSSSPRERWFLAIKEGDTPDTNPVSRLTHEWVCEAIQIRDHILRSGPNPLLADEAGSGKGEADSQQRKE